MRIMTEEMQIIQLLIKNIYRNEVIDTLMEKEIIGEGKDYADKRDWFDCKLEELKEEVKIK